MKTITITVDVDGNSISREYSDTTISGNQMSDYLQDEQRWGQRIVDILDTLEKSNEEKF